MLATDSALRLLAGGWTLQILALGNGYQSWPSHGVLMLRFPIRLQALSP